MRVNRSERGSTRTRLAIGAAVILVVAITVAAIVAAQSGSDSKATSTTTTSAPTTGKKAAAALLDQGLKALNSGNLGTAKSLFAQVIKADSQNKYGYYNLGLVYQTEGKNQSANLQYHVALTIDPTYEPALYNLAILRTAAGDTAGAIGLYQQAIAANPNDPNPHFNVGLLLRKTGKVSEGNLEVQAAVKLKPSLATVATAQGIPLK